MCRKILRTFVDFLKVSIKWNNSESNATNATIFQNYTLPRQRAQRRLAGNHILSHELKEV